MLTCFVSTVDARNASIQFKRSTEDEGTLSGYVTDPGMNPIEGSLVRVHFHGTYEEDYSDSTGYYHVTNIPICYCLKEAVCSKEGYFPESVWLVITENTTYDFVLTPIDLPCYPVINGTMGDTGWYINCVTIHFVINESVDAICYNIDGGAWQTYAAPDIITICEDGEHAFEWYFVYQGNQSDTYLIDFKIDQTLPEVTIIKERIGFNKIKITVIAEDETSGINRVEFYFDGILQYTLYVPPYEVFAIVPGFFHMISITVYDNAGNLVYSSFIVPRSHAQYNQNLKDAFACKNSLCLLSNKLSKLHGAVSV